MSPVEAHVIIFPHPPVVAAVLQVPVLHTNCLSPFLTGPAQTAVHAFLPLTLDPAVLIGLSLSSHDITSGQITLR